MWQTFAMSLTSGRIAARSTFLALAMFGASLFLDAQTQAAPLTWHLQGVTFADGGIASGSFVFDATTNDYGTINIVTTAGTTLPGSTYVLLTNGGDGFFGALETAGAPQGSRFLQLFFATPLSNAGGSRNIVPGNASYEGTCNASQVCASNPFRQITAGTVTTVSAVPEPATAALLPAALLAMALARRATGKNR